MKRIAALFCAIGLAIACLLSVPASTRAESYRSSAPEDATVYFISPQDGDTVSSTFMVKFGLMGMDVAPAGTDKMGTGHHHLLIDLADLPELDASLPATENIRHFGGGQTETTLTLPPGEHTLRLLLGNYVHIPHDPPVVSDQITITVAE
ncbi:DUF4399 domain-containing protein [Oscillatoria sp. CS-180]|uniref:DUF4399 domain-containing protein n=1 Tax=Oscillatoria sp. CS-180 TaxID=3021720 RepID=UPI002330E114|nr:DUF4399 domain-containing protein [Oscillatoria sp. CS-180]MDB9525024.1 DUF4399 domain-containing protein [Oscillatoria sp. CS-180]